MSDLLALQWERHRVCALEGQTQKGTVRLRRGFVAAWPEHINPADDPRQAGQWLKEELQRAGIGSRQVAVVLPREDCIVRRLELPNAPDDELPDLVRFQAATASSVPLERLLLDFLPLPRVDDAPGRSVLVATILKDRADQMRAALVAAGLELASLGLAPAATAELVARLEQRRGDDPQQTTLTVVRQERRVELSLVRDRRLLLAHTADLAGDDDAQDVQRLLAEINRLLVPLGALAGSSDVARAWVIDGDGADALRGSIAERFGCTASLLDPLAETELVTGSAELPGSRAAYVAPVGALLAAGGRTTEAIDFLNPRRPPVKKDRSKYRIAAAVAAAVLVAGVGYGSLKLRQADLDQAIADMQQHDRELDQFIERGKPTMASAELIDAWADQKVNWLDQLRQFHELLPGTEDVYLTDFRADPSTGDAVGRLRATGYAREPRHVEMLYQRLADRRYRVRPQGNPRYSERDPQYPYRFEVDVELLAAAEAMETRGRGDTGTR